MANTVAARYEAELGPILFSPYAQDLVERVRIQPDMRVLEVAAGTGRLTRELCKALPDSSTLVATDPSRSMLQIATRSATEGSVTWALADALQLPFRSESFDLVVSQFGVMFYGDKGKGHREAKRVLKPEGSYLFNTWSSLDDNPWASCLHRSMEALFPDDNPMGPNVPFSYHDLEQIRTDVSLSGFRHVEIEVVKKEVRALDAMQLASALVQGSPLAVSLLERGVTDLEPCVRAVASRFRAEFGADPLSATMNALVVNAH